MTDIINDDHGAAQPAPDFRPFTSNPIDEAATQVMEKYRRIQAHNMPLTGTMGPGLSEHQREMLVRLIQEAGEVVQSATKLLLFGKIGVNPHNGNVYDNVADLSMELGDLHQMTEEAFNLGLINTEKVHDGIDRKKLNLDKYLMTSRPHVGA